MSTRTRSYNQLAIGTARLIHINKLVNQIEELYPNVPEYQISDALGLGHATLNRWKKGTCMPRLTAYNRAVKNAIDIIDDNGTVPEQFKARKVPAFKHTQPQQPPAVMRREATEDAGLLVPATYIAAGAVAGALGAYIFTVM